MPKIVLPLTATKVKHAKSRDKDYLLSDGNGLYLKVPSKGNPIWIFNYTIPYTKKRTNISFGPSSIVSLASAREKAREARQLLNNNINPMAEKNSVRLAKEQEMTTTFKAIAKEWHNVKIHTVTKEFSKDIWRSLELHVFEDMGDYPITEIKPQLLMKTLKPLIEENKLETIKRVCRRVNEIMNYGVNTGLIPQNHLLQIHQAFPAPKKENLPTIDASELPKLIDKILSSKSTKTVKNLFLFQLHTMVRPSEAAGATWNEIDLSNKVWIIPKERMKRRVVHRVPLTRQVLEILVNQRKYGDSKYVFPSIYKINKPISNQSVNKAIKDCGYKGKLVAHGLRSMANTMLNNIGFDYDLTESALAHKDKNTVRAAYNRADYFERRAKMMQFWSDFIEKSYKK